MKRRISHTAIATLLAATFAGAASAGLIECSMTEARISTNDVWASVEWYSEEPTLISFSETGVDEIASAFCHTAQMTYDRVDMDEILVRCEKPDGSVTITVNRMSGTFWKLMLTNGGENGVATEGTCATATRRF
jgi:hypothetical protein